MENIHDQILKEAAEQTTAGDDKVWVTRGQMRWILQLPAIRILQDSHDGANPFILVQYAGYRFQRADTNRWWADLVPATTQPTPTKSSIGLRQGLGLGLN